ncbi:MAG: pseudouridine synthase [Woeseiaceae bacterium]|nr:pseudouridine synthase [Woeseiaceae bacterium]
MPLLILNKPFHVLSQFSSDGDRQTLADYVETENVYPAGRLDFDSEGLLLLTDDGRLQAAISSPKAKIDKCYYAQVEGAPDHAQLESLRSGVSLKDGPARALSASEIGEPEELWPRDPPIRYRASIPDTWIELCIDEGRNRQVRRMTAAAGLPTLRLIRWRVGPWTLDGLSPGQHREIPNNEAWRELKAYRRR